MEGDVKSSIKVSVLRHCVGEEYAPIFLLEYLVQILDRRPVDKQVVVHTLDIALLKPTTNLAKLLHEGQGSAVQSVIERERVRNVIVGERDEVDLGAGGGFGIVFVVRHVPKRDGRDVWIVIGQRSSLELLQVGPQDQQALPITATVALRAIVECTFLFNSLVSTSIWQDPPPDAPHQGVSFDLFRWVGHRVPVGPRVEQEVRPENSSATGFGVGDDVLGRLSERVPRERDRCCNDGLPSRAQRG